MVGEDYTDVFDGSYELIDIYDPIMTLYDVKLSPKISEEDLLKRMILK